jgi:hypothetical protein
VRKLLNSESSSKPAIFSQVAFGLCESRILQIVDSKNYSMNKRTLCVASRLLYTPASTVREATTMNATTTANGTKVGLNQVEQMESTAAVRAAQSVLLSELPGMTFAFLTLAYVVLSLVGLA